MAILIQLLIGWVRNFKSMGIIFLIFLVWLFVWFAHGAIYSNCGQVENTMTFLRDGCIEEGVRNSRLIKKFFSLLLLTGVFVSFVVSLFDSAGNIRK